MAVGRLPAGPGASLLPTARQEPRPPGSGQKGSWQMFHAEFQSSHGLRTAEMSSVPSCPAGGRRSCGAETGASVACANFQGFLDRNSCAICQNAERLFFFPRCPKWESLLVRGAGRSCCFSVWITTGSTRPRRMRLRPCFLQIFFWPFSFWRPFSLLLSSCQLSSCQLSFLWTSF